MSVQNRIYTAPQVNQGSFVQPAPVAGGLSNSGAVQQNISSFSSSSALFHRNPPRDPFSLSAPVTTTVSTLPGTGGVFLSPSVNSHTSFTPTPTRTGVTKTETSVMKPPKPPEKPLMPYMRYSRRMWEKVRLSNPDSKLWDIGKIIGQMWRELPESSRQVYVDEYEAEKQEYDKALKSYHNSPSYQAYLLSKNRAHGRGEKTSSVAAESGIYIQPVDEDEGDAGQFSLKQLAASRFHRNHRLMREIFTEAQVPDARNVITAQRLGVLKKQVNSLTLHQNKLEEELKQLEAKFEAKKRKMSDASAQFSVALKKICSHKIEPFDELVERSKAYLLNAYEQFKLQEQKQRQALLKEVPQLGEGNADQSAAPIKTEQNVNASGTSGQNQENQLKVGQSTQGDGVAEMPTGEGDSGIQPSGDATTTSAKSPTSLVRHEQSDTSSNVGTKPNNKDDDQQGESLPAGNAAASREGEGVSVERLEEKRVGDNAAAGDSAEKVNNDDTVEGSNEKVGENNDGSLSSLPLDDSNENSQEA